jgi:hypothetical protein
MAKKTDKKEVKVDKSGASKLLRCTCTSDPYNNSLAAEYQNEKYGEGIRIHTARTNKAEYTCTICGKTKTS